MRDGVAEEAIRSDPTRRRAEALPRILGAAEVARADDLLEVARRAQEESVRVMEQVEADGNLACVSRRSRGRGVDPGAPSGSAAGAAERDSGIQARRTGF